MSRRARFRLRPVFVAFIGCLGLFGASRTFAAAPPAREPVPVALTWVAPKTCPNGRQVEGRIVEHLGREGIVPDPQAGLIVRATITVVGGRHELVLEIENPVGTTRTDAGDELCDALAELVAIKVSLALDPVETARQLLPKEEPVAPDPEPKPTPELTPRPEAEPTTPPVAKRPRPTVMLQVAPVVGGGALPSVDAGGFLSVGVGGRLWQVNIGALASSGPGADVSEPDNASVGLVLALAGATACVVPLAGQVALRSCIGLDVGAVHGRGVDLAENRAAWSPLVAPAIETGLSWPQNRRVRLLMRARARVHALRPSFAVQGLGEVHRAGVVGGHVMLGMEAVLSRR